MKALINALAIALYEHGEEDAHECFTFGEAKAFAERFVAENADLLTGPPARPQNASLPPAMQTALVHGVGDPERVAVHTVPVVGGDGLTEKQRGAVGTVGLCPNCQQPNNDHLPGCARASGEVPKAITKNPLPPAV